MQRSIEATGFHPYIKRGFAEPRSFSAFKKNTLRRTTSGVLCGCRVRCLNDLKRVSPVSEKPLEIRFHFRSSRNTRPAIRKLNTPVRSASKSLRAVVGFNIADKIYTRGTCREAIIKKLLIQILIK